MIGDARSLGYVRSGPPPQHHSRTSYAAGDWRDATADDPCPVCRRSEGCRVNDRKIACVWTHTHLGTRRLAADGTSYTLYSRDAFRHVPSIEHGVQLLLRYFFSRTDLVAFAPPWDMPACPALGGDALPHLLRAHLGGPKVCVPWKTARKEGLTRQAGRSRIGSYGPAPDGSTRWVVADFDGGPGHAAPLASPTAVAVSAYRDFWRAGVPAYLERSRSGSGWHLWTFFRSPIPAAKARALASALLPDDAATVDGTRADIEIFPKRDDLGGRRVGAQVWLPWFCGASRGGNVFYHPADGRLTPFIPEDFEAMSESDVDAALAHGGAV